MMVVMTLQNGDECLFLFPGLLTEGKLKWLKIF